ncbi:hypothetical protein CRG98_048980, partial [Punica granatum]
AAGVGRNGECRIHRLRLSVTASQLLSVALVSVAS